jgi:molybdate transport repressor ModE-like protein
MYRITVRPEWSLKRPGVADFPLPQILKLLAAVHETGSLAGAAKSINMSYRHAWGLVREADEVFGSPLIRMERGRGGQLTRLGEILLWADRRIAARLTPLLDSLSSELSAEMEAVVSHAAPVRLQASHGFAVQVLKDSLTDANVDFDLRYTSSIEALNALCRHECDFAGFHVPVGHRQNLGLQPYLDALQQAPWRLVELATRTQGLMLAAGNPLDIQALEDIPERSARFVNRQPGSGTRHLIDLLLDEQALDRHAIVGYDSWEYTHAAVAAYIASDMADVGFGVETAAQRFGLDFVPITAERYFFACLPAKDAPPMVEHLLDHLKTPELRSAIAELPGYDASRSGHVQNFDEAFGASDTAPRKPGKSRSA